MAAAAGIIVFGSLMGAMFIGQQYLQNVLGYSTLEAGASIIPAALLMVLVAPRSARIVEARGAAHPPVRVRVRARRFLTMLLLWNEGSPYWCRAWLRVRRGRRRLRRHARLALADGLGAGHPRRHGLRDRRSPARPRRRDHAVDLRRAPHRGLRRSGAAALAGAPTPTQVSTSVQSQLTMSFAGAADVAAQYPQYSAADHRRALRPVPRRRRLGVPRRDHRRRSLGAALVLLKFPGGRRASPPAGVSRRRCRGSGARRAGVRAGAQRRLAPSRGQRPIVPDRAGSGARAAARRAVAGHRRAAQPLSMARAHATREAEAVQGGRGARVQASPAEVGRSSTARPAPPAT